MKIVVDTNVLVSALIKPGGIPAQIFMHETPFTLVISEKILAELQRVLHYPRLQTRYGLSDELIDEYVRTIRAESEVVEEADYVTGVSADPDDDKFLACAVAGQAEYIVSGDPHLTTLGSYQNIPILMPRQFLTVLQAGT